MIGLLVRSFGRVKGSFAAVTLLLVALQLSIIAAASTFVYGDNFTRLTQVMPTFLVQAMGPAFTSFQGMVLFAYFDPLIVMILVQFAIYIATEPAGEIETSLVDLLMSRPLPRHWIVSRSLLVMGIAAVTMSGAMFATTWVGLWWLAPQNVQWPDPRTALSLCAHVTIVACCFGSIALAASGWARRRGTAQGSIAILAFAAYLIDLLGIIWAPARDLARISPFHYYRAPDILAGTAHQAQNLAILMTITLFGMALAYWRFQRRDL